ncbi:TPA: M13-type metalloendopeptidase [Streptococcus suis]
MGKKKKIILSSLGIGITAILAAGGFIYWNATKEVAFDKNATVQSNFYQAINKSWLETARIDSDMPFQSVLLERQETIFNQLSEDLTQLTQNKESLTSNDQKELVSLYQLATDFEKREKDGLAPLKEYISKLERLENFEQFLEQKKELYLDSYTLPFYISVSPDSRNSNKKIMTIGAPSAILPDTTYYEDDSSKEQILSLFESSTLKSLKAYGYAEKEAKNLIEKTLAFDEQLVPYLMSNEEASDAANLIHITSITDLDKQTGTVLLGTFANDLVAADISEVNIENTKFIESFDKIVHPDNFELIKAWMIVKNILSNSTLLTEEFRQASSDYDLALSGTSELLPKEEVATQQAIGVFSETVSVYYGNKYFGKNAKHDVTKMIDSIMAVYKERLQNNTWLSDSTKKTAIEKLDNMNYYIGYPETVSELTSQYKIDKNSSYFDNLREISRMDLAYLLDNFSNPIDKSSWIAPAFQVNAFYAPSTNSIYFPAAILNEPMYSEKQSLAENYGGIGAVIGHEITHAFDNNGAKYDKDGNYVEWWTAEDYAAFELRTEEMVQLFDGIEIYDKKVNGKMTVSENIADAGGLSASLEALIKADPTVDKKEFFESWAKIWAQKERLQYAQLLLDVDTHSPNELRVNVQLKNMDAFYQTYQINETDAMYLPEEERVTIW